jgi:endonuclease/exonuclease/phosphatase (EEP) superfamily protein YafD
LTNLPAQFGLQTTRTELTTKTEVCDYIFVNDSVTVNSFGAIDKLASDHKALILEFDI